MADVAILQSILPKFCRAFTLFRKIRISESRSARVTDTVGAPSATVRPNALDTSAHIELMQLAFKSTVAAHLVRRQRWQWSLVCGSIGFGIRAAFVRVLESIPFISFGGAHVVRSVSMWRSTILRTSSARETPKRFASFLSDACCGSVNEIICLITVDKYTHRYHAWQL